MKYRIIEEIDAFNDSKFYAQYAVKNLFGKVTWEYCTTDIMGVHPADFPTADKALWFLKKFYTPKTRIVVKEGVFNERTY